MCPRGVRRKGIAGTLASATAVARPAGRARRRRIASRRPSPRQLGCTCSTRSPRSSVRSASEVTRSAAPFRAAQPAMAASAVRVPPWRGTPETGRPPGATPLQRRASTTRRAPDGEHLDDLPRDVDTEVQVVPGARHEHAAQIRTARGRPARPHPGIPPNELQALPELLREQAGGRGPVLGPPALELLRLTAGRISELDLHVSPAARPRTRSRRRRRPARWPRPPLRERAANEPAPRARIRRRRRR